MNAPHILVPSPRGDAPGDEPWVETAAAWIEGTLREALERSPRVSVALCGGTTPAPVYTRLAASPLPWGRIELFVGDERCVAADDPQSNQRLVREALCEQVPGEPPRLHPVEGEDPDHDAAARRYEARLPGRFDLVVGGMGEDGHTASLFPGQAALTEERRRVVHVLGPKPPPDRLTLTPPVLTGARCRVVLVRGAGKADILRQVLEGPLDPRRLPAQLMRDGTWILDQAAATALARPLPGGSP